MNESGRITQLDSRLQSTLNAYERDILDLAEALEERDELIAQLKRQISQRSRWRLFR